MISDAPQDLIDVYKSLFETTCVMCGQKAHSKKFEIFMKIFSKIFVENFSKIFWELFLKIMAIATDENIYHLLDNDKNICFYSNSQYLQPQGT